MGRMIELTAADGHRFDAYEALPPGKPRGAIVMIHEIFGLTGQMKRCADHYAAEGYVVLVPAMFDRRERQLNLGYGDFMKGGTIASSITGEEIAKELEACRSHLAGQGKLALIGYCWGGTVAYQGASQGGFACAVSCYGSGIGRLVDKMHPKVPVQYHYGEKDSYIPPAAIDKVRAADPTGEFHVYAGAGHGFHCDDREGFHAEATRLSDERTLAFLARHLA